MRYWVSWIQSNWKSLKSGKKISAPTWLGHPSYAGFRQIDLAARQEQCRDWGLSFDDGSRVHVHEFEDGRLLVHRDRYDPAKSLGSLFAHLLGETVLGPVLLVVGLGVVAQGLSKA